MLHLIIPLLHSTLGSVLDHCQSQTQLSNIAMVVFKLLSLDVVEWGRGLPKEGC